MKVLTAAALGTLLCGGLAQGAAFDGTRSFATRQHGVDHTLTMSGWRVDAKGMPSFDYVYEQHAGACRFRLAGRATGDMEEVGGKLGLVVYNPEDERGSEKPPIVTFEAGEASFVLPFKDALNHVGLMSKLEHGLRTRACDKGVDERLDVSFRK